MKELLELIFKKLDIKESEFRVINENFYKRLGNCESLSLLIGESYMEGEWISDDIASFFRKVIDTKMDNYSEFLFSALKDYPINTARLIWNIAVDDIKTQCSDYFKNRQSEELSKRVGKEHYDIPDILYEYMLDSQRQYTCGYWKKDTKTLEEAQENKINLLIDKLQIPDNVEMNILDIGCGWGGLTNSIYKRYPKCKIEGISISEEQIKKANETYKNDKLFFSFCDYRDLPKREKKYDRIISVGMFEHVGVKNYDIFFNVCESILEDNGIFVLHTITKQRYSKYITGQINHTASKWLDKYIFPGGYIPTTFEVLQSCQYKRLICQHSQNLSVSYAKTLEQWYNNFKKHWDTIRKTNPDFFNDRFFKMWEFYLVSSMVCFETKDKHLTQFVLTKEKYDGMYIFNE